VRVYRQCDGELQHPGARDRSDGFRRGIDFLTHRLYRGADSRRRGARRRAPAGGRPIGNAPQSHLPTNTSRAALTPNSGLANTGAVTAPGGNPSITRAIEACARTITSTPRSLLVSASPTIRS